MRNDKVRDENGQTRLLMGCIYNPDLMDEPLLKYMLENKEEMIDDFCYVSEDRYGVTKNNLWSKIKSEANKGGQSLAKVTITKWAKILNKDVNEKALYKYSKTKFYNKKKNDEEAYVPFFFSENQGDFLDVSEDFFAITRHQIFNVIKPESLSNTEMKLIINDLLNDDNVNDYVLMRCENYTELVETIKNFIINNCEEMLGIAKRQKKSLLKLIANGSIVLNDAIQSIQGEELDVFLSKNNLEKDYLQYVRKSHSNKDFTIKMIEGYKSKETWLKELKCYSKENNRFSVKNAISPFITITDKLNSYCEGSDEKITKWDVATYAKKLNESSWQESIELAIRVLSLFQDELKNSANYRTEMEKLTILSIIMREYKLYKAIKDFMIDENSYMEDLKFKSIQYERAAEVNSWFMETVAQNEKIEFNRKINEKLSTKGVKAKTNKI